MIGPSDGRIPEWDEEDHSYYQEPFQVDFTDGYYYQSYGDESYYQYNEENEAPSGYNEYNYDQYSW